MAELRNLVTGYKRPLPGKLTFRFSWWVAGADPSQTHKIVMPASEPIRRTAASISTLPEHYPGYARLIAAQTEQWIARSDASAQGRNDGNWLKIAAWQGNISAR